MLKDSLNQFERKVQFVRKADNSWLVIALAVGLLVSAPAGASQVEKVVFSGGSGAQQMLTVGQSVIGTSNPNPGEVSIGLGFWHMLRDTHIVSGVAEIPGAQNRLMRNYPNPFNPSTTINFTLAQKSEVSIDVYDLKGLRVDTLLRGQYEAGTHSLTYQPKNLASGTYFVSMRAGEFRATQRIMLVK